MDEDKKMEQVGVTTLVQAKRNVIEYLWLKYFNDTLFSQGYISEKDHRKMSLWITNRKCEAGTRKKAENTKSIQQGLIAESTLRKNYHKPTQEHGERRPDNTP